MCVWGLSLFDIRKHDGRGFYFVANSHCLYSFFTLPKIYELTNFLWTEGGFDGSVIYAIDDFAYNSHDDDDCPRCSTTGATTTRSEDDLYEFYKFTLCTVHDSEKSFEA
jgi:hypothetical protein